MNFRGEFEFLSNMYVAPIAIYLYDDYYLFSTVEAAFQAAKCPSRAGEFAALSGPEAKRLGRKVSLRPDWEAVKISIMTNLVKAKFEQHPDLMLRLKNIPGEIVEDNAWGDRFWGRCNGTGRNELGKILMQIRDN